MKAKKELLTQFTIILILFTTTIYCFLVSYSLLVYPSNLRFLLIIAFIGIAILLTSNYFIIMEFLQEG